MLISEMPLIYNFINFFFHTIKTCRVRNFVTALPLLETNETHIFCFLGIAKVTYTASVTTCSLICLLPQSLQLVFQIISNLT